MSAFVAGYARGVGRAFSRQGDAVADGEFAPPPVETRLAQLSVTAEAANRGKQAAGTPGVFQKGIPFANDRAPVSNVFLATTHTLRPLRHVGYRRRDRLNLRGCGRRG